jgi:hypothetical protein
MIETLFSLRTSVAAALVAWFPCSDPVVIHQNQTFARIPNFIISLLRVCWPDHQCPDWNTTDELLLPIWVMAPVFKFPICVRNELVVFPT